MGWLSKIFGSSTNDFEVGYHEEYGLGFDISLIFKEEGWYLWKIKNGNSTSLMIIKPAVGESPPKPSGLVLCYGGKGFYGHIYKSFFDKKELYLSFYGSQKYRGSVRCSFEGRLFESLTEVEILNMDGGNISFEVTTSPIQKRSDSGTYRKESGIVSLTGSTIILEKLKDEYNKLD